MKLTKIAPADSAGTREPGPGLATTIKAYLLLRTDSVIDHGYGVDPQSAPTRSQDAPPAIVQPATRWGELLQLCQRMRTDHGGATGSDRAPDEVPSDATAGTIIQVSWHIEGIEQGPRRRIGGERAVRCEHQDLGVLIHDRDLGLDAVRQPDIIVIGQSHEIAGCECPDGLGEVLRGAGDRVLLTGGRRNDLCIDAL